MDVPDRRERIRTAEEVTRAFSVALLVFVVGAIGYVAWVAFTSDELRSKSEWSALQNLEYLHRNDPSRELKLGTNEEFVAASVLSKDGKTRNWILLNPKAEPIYKQMPEVDFTLSQRSFVTLKTRPGVHPEVLKQLRQHIISEL